MPQLVAGVADHPRVVRLEDFAGVSVHVAEIGDRRARARHLDGLRKAGITQWPFGFEGRETDRLNAGQLGALIHDTTWTGAHQNGTRFMQFFDQAGNTAYRSANTNITGTVRVRDGQLCQRFDGYFLGRRTCGRIYRNSGGARAAAGTQEAADYVHVTPRDLKFFSLGRSTIRLDAV